MKQWILNKKIIDAVTMQLKELQIIKNKTRYFFKKILATIE